VFFGRRLLDAKLRCASIDAADGAVETVARIPAFAGTVQLRRRWPEVRILVRVDSGLAPDALMAWCEANGVHFLSGLAQNERLVAMIAGELAQAEGKSRRTGKASTSGQPARSFKEFRWQTRNSWSRERRVIAKAEFTGGEASPRFVVTSLTRRDCKPKYLYEKLYCARGEMENRIKECQLDLYADRTSTATMRANQLRLWFASMAYVLLCASCGTIRLKFMNIGAPVCTSAGRRSSTCAISSPAAPARRSRRRRRPRIRWHAGRCRSGYDAGGSAAGHSEEAISVGLRVVPFGGALRRRVSGRRAARAGRGVEANGGVALDHSRAPHQNRHGFRLPDAPAARKSLSSARVSRRHGVARSLTERENHPQN
jgi:DDE family transposase